MYVIFYGALVCIATLNNSIIAKEYPKFLIITFGFEFAKLMGILQLSHILGIPYTFYTPSFVIPLFI